MALITEKPANLGGEHAGWPVGATIATSRLIEVLTDALHTTADDTCGGIHVATSRAPWGGNEAGERDVLAATSTTGSVMGHCWVACDGQIPASVWPEDAARNVLAIAKSLAKKGGDEDPRTVDISAVRAPGPDDDDEHPGWIVTVRDSPALFDSDTELQFHAHHESRFPTAAINRILSGAGDLDVRLKNVPLTVWSATVLKPLVAVAARRKAPIQLYRQTGRAAHLVQIGETWLGAAMCRHPDPEQDTQGPSIEAVLTEPDAEDGER